MLKLYLHVHYFSISQCLFYIHLHVHYFSIRQHLLYIHLHVHYFSIVSGIVYFKPIVFTLCQVLNFVL